MKVIKTILITTVLCLCYITIFAQKDSLGIYRISKEQKIFEFSQIYRELYYNFANMDNCPEINIDSLYFSLIPDIINSEDDWDYFGTIEQFLYKLKSGHTSCYIWPDYIINQLDKLAPQVAEEIKEEELSETLLRSNIFITDAINDFAYIKLTECTIEDFHNFFMNNYDSIVKFNNLIVDVWYNVGGDGGATMVVNQALLNQDTIYYYPEKTKINNSVMKARATVKIHYQKPENVPQDFKDKYYSYYYNNHFEPDTYIPKYYLNQIPDTSRFKGNIYLIVGKRTASAGEGFSLFMSQGENVKTFGKKTAGAFGQPLLVYLKSGMVIMLNTTKTYDYKNNEVSTGFVPEYDYDFSDFYNMENKQEMLLKFIEVIKNFEK